MKTGNNSNNTENDSERKSTTLKRRTDREREIDDALARGEQIAQTQRPILKRPSTIRLRGKYGEFRRAGEQEGTGIKRIEGTERTETGTGRIGRTEGAETGGIGSAKRTETGARPRPGHPPGPRSERTATIKSLLPTDPEESNPQIISDVGTQDMTETVFHRRDFLVGKAQKRLAVTKQTVMKVIEQQMGRITHVARALKCDYSRLRNYINGDKDLSQALEAVKEKGLDLAESKLLEHVNKGNLQAITFFLQSQGKGRGYTYSPTATPPAKPIPFKYLDASKSKKKTA